MHGELATVEGEPVSLSFKFNPKELTFGKQNTWNTPHSGRGKNSAPLEFGGGQPKDLKMQLLFDTFAGENSPDVRTEYTNKLLKMMQIDSKLKDNRTQTGRPPKCHLRWGRLWSFNCVIESLSLKFTLFTSSGTPVRALVDLTLKQAEDEAELKGQNPSSVGHPGSRVWTVQPGDRLDWIAHTMLGDPTLWRRIAEENALLDARDLVPGRRLTIPPYA